MDGDIMSPSARQGERFEASRLLTRRAGSFTVGAMRPARGLILLIFAFLGCAHNPPPPTAQTTSSKPPKGDLIRLKPATGDQPSAKATLDIEQESAGPGSSKSGALRKLTLNFTLVEEEKVETVTPDGTAQISARLADVDGQASTGVPQSQVNEMAMALDELKVQFRRSPRGEVAAVTLSGLRSPLDEKTARLIVSAFYSGNRGPILPPDSVEVGGTWKEQTNVPTTFGVADATYLYKYVAKDNGVAVITGEGAFESKAGGGATPKRMIGKINAEYKVDLATGRIVAVSDEVSTQVEDTIPAQSNASAVRTRVKVRWALEAGEKK
jgi:hypothetical protein